MQHTPIKLCNPGDLVVLSDMIYLYNRRDFKVHKSKRYAVVLKSSLVQHDDKDCQDLNDENIQHEYLLYSVLYEGKKIEVLDIDLTYI